MAQSTPRGRKPEDYPVHMDFRVRFRDLDPYHHMNNGTYMTLFDDIRMEYLKRLSFIQNEIAEKGDVLKAMVETFPSVVVKAEVEFRGQATIHQMLRVCTRIDAIRKSFIDFYYGVFALDNQMAYTAGGKTTLIAIDPENGKPTKVPEYIIRSVEELERRSIQYIV